MFSRIRPALPDVNEYAQHLSHLATNEFFVSTVCPKSRMDKWLTFDNFFLFKSNSFFITIEVIINCCHSTLLVSIPVRGSGPGRVGRDSGAAHGDPV